MDVIDRLDISRLPPRSVVTIGNFDGFHLGHQALVRKVVEEAEQSGCQKALLTFDPHPQEVIHPGDSVLRICTSMQRLALFEQAALDEVHILPFTPELSQLEAEEFAQRFLIQRFQLEKLVIGYDFRFGKHRQGDFKTLEELGYHHGFEVEEVSPIKVDQQTVSSTHIRQLIQAHEFGGLPEFLGRPYSILGVVEQGDQRGRQLGFPTANLRPEIPLALPNGVYASNLVVQGREYQGVTNVGVRPTFGQNTATVETWIFDFSGELYGETLEVRPQKFLRPEQRFAGVDALKEQISKDVQAAEDFFRADAHLSHAS
ncbi:MAG: bifunctional riboflavin kinase/FAD synthetase [SAR324 cluster bacterium]|nr:bifunctional riboflavin kinase/FAD synthetase [SAR324 cluster bacterium]